jgi:hypothetical protein
MIYTHVLNRGPAAVRSPADRLFIPDGNRMQSLDGRKTSRWIGFSRVADLRDAPMSRGIVISKAIIYSRLSAGLLGAPKRIVVAHD